MASATEFTEPDALHRLRNHLGVVLCFAELVAETLQADDPRRADVAAIHDAAKDALALLPEISSAT